MTCDVSLCLSDQIEHTNLTVKSLFTTFLEERRGNGLGTRPLNLPHENQPHNVSEAVVWQQHNTSEMLQDIYTEKNEIDVMGRR